MTAGTAPRGVTREGIVTRPWIRFLILWVATIAVFIVLGYVLGAALSSRALGGLLAFYYGIPFRLVAAAAFAAAPVLLGRWLAAEEGWRLTLSIWLVVIAMHVADVGFLGPIWRLLDPLLLAVRSGALRQVVSVIGLSPLNALPLALTANALWLVLPRARDRREQPRDTLYVWLIGVALVAGAIVDTYDSLQPLVSRGLLSGLRTPSGMAIAVNALLVIVLAAGAAAVLLWTYRKIPGSGGAPRRTDAAEEARREWEGRLT